MTSDRPPRLFVGGLGSSFCPQGSQTEARESLETHFGRSGRIVLLPGLSNGGSGVSLTAGRFQGRLLRALGSSFRTSGPPNEVSGGCRTSFVAPENSREITETAFWNFPSARKFQKSVSVILFFCNASRLYIDSQWQSWELSHIIECGW